MASRWEVWYWYFDLGAPIGGKPQKVFDTLKEAAEFGDKLRFKLDRAGMSDMVGVHVIEVEE